MIHPDTELRFVSEKIGYGVFATRPIPRGTLIWTLCCFDRVYSREQALALPAPYRELLGTYAYISESGDYVLCWDNGRYVNHSCDPAMRSMGLHFDIAVRDLAPGDPVTCDYGSLNPTGVMRCHCGASACRGEIRASDVLKLWPEWDACVADVLPSAAAVPQPLLPFAREPSLFQAWCCRRALVPSHLGLYIGSHKGEALPGEAAPWALLGAAKPRAGKEPA